MKKKYTIIPVVAIVLAVLTGLFITFFTTPLTLYLCDLSNAWTEHYNANGEKTYTSNDYFYDAKKVGKILKFAYAINPSLENLDALKNTYSPYNYIHGKYYGKTAPSDFLKNCVKYQKLNYEADYMSGDSPYATPVSPFTENAGYMFFTVPSGIDYAKALFLDGQTEESKKIYKEVFKGVDKNNLHDIKFFAASAKDYLYLLYSSTENVSVRQWVLEREAEIEKALVNDESTSKYIENHGFLFSNPDYDTYVSGYWADDEAIEDETEETEIAEDNFSETAQTPTP